MSCGAECLMDMLEFNGMDRFRGSPGCCGKNFKLSPSYGDPAVYGGSNTGVSYDTLSNPNDKYSSSLSKKGYDLGAEKNYFESPTALKNYLALVYRPAAYFNVMPVKSAEINTAPEIKQNIMEEIDSLEAMINAARQRESLKWIQ